MKLLRELDCVDISIYKRIIRYTILRSYTGVINYIRKRYNLDKEILEINNELLLTNTSITFGMIYIGVLYGEFVEDPMTLRGILQTFRRTDIYIDKHYDEIIIHLIGLFPKSMNEQSIINIDRLKNKMNKSARK